MWLRAVRRKWPVPAAPLKLEKVEPTPEEIIEAMVSQLTYWQSLSSRNQNPNLQLIEAAATMILMTFPTYWRLPKATD